MKSYKKKIVFGITLLFIITMLFPVFEAQFVESLNVPESIVTNTLSTHRVLAEEGTATWCGYCPAASAQLYQCYTMGLDFSIVTLVADMNGVASSRCSELGLTGYPTVFFDGGYTKVVGQQPDYTTYYNAIINCGNRAVADITLTLTAYWMGSGQIQVNVGVTNNGASTYNGHLHAYVTEISSRWDDASGTPYHFAMINDYALNQAITVSGSSTQSYSNTWSGYTDISMSNIKVIASVFSPTYTDETIAVDPQYSNSDPPSTPSQPSGPSSGYVGIPYTFSTSSTEPNGDQIKYGWDWDGDSDVDDWTDLYPSGQTASTSNSWDSVGTYTIKVKAKDQFGQESGWSSGKTIQISLGDAPNIPSTPSGPNNGIHKTSYTYTTSTTDPNAGDGIFYKFDWGDSTTSQWLGPYDSGETASAEHAWSDAGTFNIKVKAKDYANSESDWSNAYSVFMGNTPPNKPSRPSGPITGAVGTKYKFSTSTTDPENDNIEYFFYWGDNTDSGWIPYKYAEHVWVKGGEYGVKAKARDKWAESEWSQAITITIESGSLTVNIQANPENAVINQQIQFSGTASGGKEPYTFNWDLGDGNTSNQQNPTHKYKNTGNYVITLSVQDSIGAFGSNYITMNIELSNPPEKPIIIEGLESAIINQPCNFTFTTTDPNDDNVYLFVDWGDGTESTWEGPFESGDNDMVLSHTWEKDGVYTVKAKAKDTYDYESEWSEEFEITVGWQDAFIIGSLSGKEEKEDTTEVTVLSVMYLSFNPFKIKLYNSGEVIIISNESKGIITNTFIIGKFKTGYI